MPPDLYYTIGDLLAGATMSDFKDVGLPARGEMLKGKWCLITGASQGVGHKVKSVPVFSSCLPVLAFTRRQLERDVRVMSQYLHHDVPATSFCFCGPFSRD